MTGLTPEMVLKLSQASDRVLTMSEAVEELKKKHAKLEELVGKIPVRKVLPSIGAAWGTDSADEADDKRKLFLHWLRCIWSRKTFENTPDYIKKSLTEGTDSEGGYLVPEIFIPELIRVIELQGQMRPIVRKFPMTTDTSHLPSLVSGMTVYWPGELQIITQGDPVFGRLTLTARTMAALTSASVQLEEDSQLALADLIVTLFGEAIAREEDKQFLNSNAAPFTGVLHAANVNVVTMPTGDDNFADVTWLNFSDLIDAVTTNAAKNGKFYMHRNITNLVRKIRDLNHNFIWAPPMGGAKGPGTIWGYDIVESDQMPSLADTAASTAFVAFGDPLRLFLGDRSQMSVARSDEVGFKSLEVFWRVTERIAVLVGVPTAFSRLRTAA